MPKTIYSVLEKEHRTVSDLMDRLESADTEERSRLAGELRMELLTHADAESATFYDALREFDEARERVQVGEQEHEEIRALLEEMDGLDGDRDAFLSMLGRLRTAVGHHVQEEETEIFGKARELLTDEEAQDLAEEFLQEKESLMAD